MSRAEILTLNAGSSSLKFAVFSGTGPERRLLSGAVERIGMPQADFDLRDGDGKTIHRSREPVATHAQALAGIRAELERLGTVGRLMAVGHRIAHGGPDCDCPAAVTPALIAKLGALTALAPMHMPAGLAVIDAVAVSWPDLLQFASFDTAFHHALPPVARMTGLPRDLSAPEIRRYGYHGLSYEYIVAALAADGVDVGRERIIILHLGNGASICAVRGGKSVETTMGFSTVAGLPMGTRSGDLDPGLIDYLLATGRLDAAGLTGLLYDRSGLAGLSGISRNMADLLASPDPAAKEAIDYFCYHARRHLAGLCASIGGVDRVVFTGGIGYRAPAIRAAICAGLDYLGISIDPARNRKPDPAISVADRPVVVEARNTDEEVMIARHVRDGLAGSRPMQQEVNR